MWKKWWLLFTVIWAVVAALQSGEWKEELEHYSVPASAPASPAKAATA